MLNYDHVLGTEGYCTGQVHDILCIGLRSENSCGWECNATEGATFIELQHRAIWAILLQN